MIVLDFNLNEIVIFVLEVKNIETNSLKVPF